MKEQVNQAEPQQAADDDRFHTLQELTESTPVATRKLPHLVTPSGGLNLTFRTYTLGNAVLYKVTQEDERTGQLTWTPRIFRTIFFSSVMFYVLDLLYAKLGDAYGAAVKTVAKAESTWSSAAAFLEGGVMASVRQILLSISLGAVADKTYLQIIFKSAMDYMDWSKYVPEFMLDYPVKTFNYAIIAARAVSFGSLVSSMIESVSKYRLQQNETRLSIYKVHRRTLVGDPANSAVASARVALHKAHDAKVSIRREFGVHGVPSVVHNMTSGQRFLLRTTRLLRMHYLAPPRACVRCTSDDHLRSRRKCNASFVAVRRGGVVTEPTLRYSACEYERFYTKTIQRQKGAVGLRWTLTRSRWSSKHITAIKEDYGSCRD